MNSNFLVLILAAGKGTRFKSHRIKVLHPILGKSMLRIVADTLCDLDPEEFLIVVGYQKDKVMKEGFVRKVRFVVQEEQLGTADAVRAAVPVLDAYRNKSVLVMNGDLPLVRTETLKPFLEHHFSRNQAMTFMTADLDNPFGFGRVVHGNGDAVRIIEEQDATSEQKKIRESNLGVYLFKIGSLLDALPKISTDNAKGEYYLTDIIEIIMQSGLKSGPFKTAYKDEFVGVNDRFELAAAADVLRQRKMEFLAKSGVSIQDPSSTWIDLDVEIGRDTTVSPFVVIEGASTIGEQCRIHPFVHIVNSRIGDGAEVMASNIVEDCCIERNQRIEPFTHLKDNHSVRDGCFE